MEVPCLIHIWQALQVSRSYGRVDNHTSPTELGRGEAIHTNKRTEYIEIEDVNVNTTPTPNRNDTLMLSLNLLSWRHLHNERTYYTEMKLWTDESRNVGIGTKTQTDWINNDSLYKQHMWHRARIIYHGFNRIPRRAINIWHTYVVKDKVTMHAAKTRSSVLHVFIDYASMGKFA